MITRGERIGQFVTVAFAAVFAIAVWGSITGGILGGAVASTAGRPGGTTSAPASPTPTPPKLTFTHDTCCEQAARFFNASFESTETVRSATVVVNPSPGFDCSATVDAAGKKGTFGCVGLLKGATAFTATLRVVTAGGSFPFEHKFKTMGDRLENVKWFTQFEDLTIEPLACAAASCRIIQNYTTGKDPMTAEQILAMGKALNRSTDPGLDPAAIAAVLTRLDARNRYHYYRLDTREEATLASAYWLVRSGKPVVVISLAGQHAPLLIGFRGVIGTFYGDPANTITGVVVQDSQRGDMRPETARRRPDMYRTPGFQTGQLLEMNEWYRGEWWLGFAYVSTLPGYGNIDRNDGVYPRPHWAGKFVIIVDDGDAENPPDREGRVKYR
ncbi:MAG: hypothetical protein FJ034_07550 [Chloroflexi bacterium]|nr:hypothetical protein [Chloroflexota bacterium]